MCRPGKSLLVAVPKPCFHKFGSPEIPFCSVLSESSTSYGLYVHYSTSPGLSVYVSNVEFMSLRNALYIYLLNGNANDKIEVNLRYV